MSPAGMSLLLILTLSLFAWSAVRRWRLMMVGGSEPRFSLGGISDIVKRANNTLIYAFGQKKMPNYRTAGIAPMLIFSGFMVLLLRSIVLWGRGFDTSFDLWGLLAQGTLIGNGYGFLKDIFALLVILGASVFVYYRVISPQKRMTQGFEGLLILFIIITMMLADILYDGASIVLNLNGCGLSELSDKSNRYVFPSDNCRLGVVAPSKAKCDPPSSTTVTLINSVKFDITLPVKGVWI